MESLTSCPAFAVLFSASYLPPPFFSIPTPRVLARPSRAQTPRVEPFQCWTPLALFARIQLGSGSLLGTSPSSMPTATATDSSTTMNGVAIQRTSRNRSCRHQLSTLASYTTDTGTTLTTAGSTMSAAFISTISPESSRTDATGSASTDPAGHLSLMLSSKVDPTAIESSAVSAGQAASSSAAQGLKAASVTDSSTLLVLRMLFFGDAVGGADPASR